MDKTISIFISDSSSEFKAMLVEAVNGEADMRVCGTAEDGTEAYERVMVLRPDVLVTDMLLRQVGGVELLRRLRSANAPVKAIMTSRITDARFVAGMRCLGVEHIITKPCGAREIIHCARELAGAEKMPSVRDFDPMISEALIRFGIMPHHQGYRYLRESIRRALSDADALRGVTKILYPELARENRTTAQNVERAIRHAINSAWERYDSEQRSVYFGDAVRFDSRPSNSALIALLAEFVARKLPDGIGR